MRQGCILSPYLFSLYTDDIMRDVENDLKAVDFHELKVNGVGMAEFRYADYQALLSKLQEGLENVKKHCEEKGFYLNVKKTKIMDNG